MSNQNAQNSPLSSMHVCLTCIEFFGDSIYGGFGRATRFIGRELVKRGIRVSVVVPRRSEVRPDIYALDSMTVYQFRPSQPWNAIRMYRNCKADIYHSQDTSIGTFFAQIASPKAAHVVTFRDPMDRRDWKVETDYAKMPRLGWAQYRFFINNPLVTLAVKRANALYCAAEFFIPKTVRMYRLQQQPMFLPSPVNVPAEVRKAERPTVCYVGRWEGRKRVEFFFELARECPDIEFIALGGARDPVRDRALRGKYGGIANLKLVGVLDQFAGPEWSKMLGLSWVLVNTSLREGLPTTFIEAAAHRCAILSFTDPDGFASRFGKVAREGSLAKGLRDLLKNDQWRKKGEEGWRYASEVFEVNKAMDSHVAAYEQVIRQQRRGNNKL